MPKEKVTEFTKYRKFYCTSCDIYTNSVNQLNQHLEGIRHKQKMLTSNTLKTSNITVSEEHEFDLKVYLPAVLVIFITVYLFCYIIVKFCNW